MNANIMKTHIFYKMKYDLQGHQRSHKVILKFQRGSLAHCAFPSHSPLYLFSLLFFSLSLFLPLPLSSIPLKRRNNHPTATADKKCLTGNSCSRPSPLLLLPSLYASLSFLSLMFFFSLSLFTPSSLHWLHIHPMPLYLFSLPCSYSLFFLTLTYVLMNNFLSLFMAASDYRRRRYYYHLFLLQEIDKFYKEGQLIDLVLVWV